MLVYLTSNLKLGLFDFIQEETLPVKKLSGEFNLKKFVIQDMRSFNHIRFIALDHQALNDTDEELMEGVLGFQAMYDARIIYLAEGTKQGDELLSKLYDAGVRNFVTAVDPEEIKKEILECISPEGMSDKKAERFKIQPKIQSVEKPRTKVKQVKHQTESLKAKKGKGSEQEPVDYVRVKMTTNLGLDTEKERKGIVVGVAGITEKDGTTTTALNLACFLSNLGAKVSYIECDPIKQLNWLPYYDISVNDESAEYNGVFFYTKNVKFSFEDYDFNILDLGKMLDSGQTVNAFSRSHVRIITAASKPYEVKQLIKTLEDIKDISANLIFSFTADHDRRPLRQLVNHYPGHNVYFSAYSPDLFDPNPNRMIWTNIMSDYLQPKLSTTTPHFQSEENVTKSASELRWKEDGETLEVDFLRQLRGEIIWFWGSSPGLGVTSVVIQFAKILAKSIPVLLIDGNLAKPNLAEEFNCKGAGWEGSWLKKTPGKPPEKFYQKGNLGVWSLRSPLEIDQAAEKWSVALFHIRSPKQVVIIDGGTAPPPEGADLNVLMVNQSICEYDPATVCISRLGVEGAIPYGEQCYPLVNGLLKKLRVKNLPKSLDIVNQ
ncbi:MAG TPA: cobalamin biosynthesis protein CobQ [Desulfosporosinus sp.]|nr:cobalamin biosynthesis protein CobQ [Desulfosporosinus sp.]